MLVCATIKKQVDKPPEANSWRKVMKNKELTVAIVLAAIAAGAGSLNELSAATVGKPRANGDFGKAVKALFPEGKIPFPAK